MARPSLHPLVPGGGARISSMIQLRQLFILAPEGVASDILPAIRQQHRSMTAITAYRGASDTRAQATRVVPQERQAKATDPSILQHKRTGYTVRRGGDYTNAHADTK